MAVLGNFSTDLFRTLKEHLEWLSTLLSRRPVIFDSWVNYQLVQNLKKQLNANLPQRMLSVLLAGENIRGQLLSCYANFDYPETIVNTEKVLSSLQ